MHDCLDEKAVIADLSPLQGWQLAKDDEQRPAIEKDYSFARFNAAFAFMGRVALTAERANHHLELLNCYRRVWCTGPAIQRVGLLNLIENWPQSEIRWRLIVA